jgi:hypothetical protein
MFRAKYFVGEAVMHITRAALTLGGAQRISAGDRHGTNLSKISENKEDFDGQLMSNQPRSLFKHLVPKP